MSDSNKHDRFQSYPQPFSLFSPPPWAIPDSPHSASDVAGDQASSQEAEDLSADYFEKLVLENAAAKELESTPRRAREYEFIDLEDTGFRPDFNCEDYNRLSYPNGESYPYFMEAEPDEPGLPMSRAEVECRMKPCPPWLDILINAAKLLFTLLAGIIRALVEPVLMLCSFLLMIGYVGIILYIYYFLWTAAYDLISGPDWEATIAGSPVTAGLLYIVFCVYFWIHVILYKLGKMFSKGLEISQSFYTGVWDFISEYID